MTVVLDGGLATELEFRGHDLTDRLWSARLLVTDPGAIEAVHLDYFRAGAQVATTASYQATIPGFVAAGLDRAAALHAIATSVEVARRARDAYAAEANVDPAGLLVAGSVGPYGAMLADGAEYRGDYDPGRGVLRDLHAPRMEALLEAGADLLASRRFRPCARRSSSSSSWTSSEPRRGSRSSAGTAGRRPPASRSAKPSRSDARPRASSRSASTARRRATSRHCWRPLAPPRTCHASPIRTAGTGGTR